jgi:DNA-directed RNA polymerase subunit RPC12/RpoP
VTFEKNYSIEPSDFISVSYVCANCQASVSVPISKINPEQIATIALRGCVYCHTPSGFQPDTPEAHALLEFNRSLQEFCKLSKGRNLRMRLSIPCDEKN